MHVHEHHDHLHAHEHNHGGKENIIVSTIGLVLHSLADGSALGASIFCKLLIVLSVYSKFKISWRSSKFRSWSYNIYGNSTSQGTSSSRFRFISEAWRHSKLTLDQTPISKHNSNLIFRHSQQQPQVQHFLHILDSKFGRVKQTSLNWCFGWASCF